jgi:hypothetical protein
VAAGPWVAAGAPQAEVNSNMNRMPVIRAWHLVIMLLLLWIKFLEYVMSEHQAGVPGVRKESRQRISPPFGREGSPIMIDFFFDVSRKKMFP